MEGFDPLARLEAEYAAVLAQSRPSGSDHKEEQPQDDHDDHDDHDARSGGPSGPNNDAESEEEGEEDPDATYSLLPSSPGGGFASDDEEDEEGGKQGGDAVEKAPGGEAKEAAPTQEMPADKRLAIMQAMQKLQLQPPAWAAAGRVSDEQLVAIVQRQLQSKE